MTDMLHEAAAELVLITDPLERAVAADIGCRAFEQRAQQLRDIRDLALHELRYEGGMSVRMIERLCREQGVLISKSTISGITG